MTQATLGQRGVVKHDYLMADNANSGYLLENSQAEAGERFNSLAELFDPVTFRHLETVGIRPGWSCWEVGAGGPSVPTWLAERAGDSGQVVATDIDTSWMPASAPFAVLQHDVGAEPPPPGPFDLIHARLVLVHVPQRARALRSMVNALQPGGWLLIEDADPALQPLICPDEVGQAQQLANRLREGFRALMVERGADLSFGRTLPRLLREHGLTDVRADAYFPITSPACTALEAATIRQIGDQLVAAGIADAADIDQHLSNITSGELDLATAPLISAWGRKPGSAEPN